MTKRETRILDEVRLEQRAEGDGKKIVGYAAVFNSPTDMGGFFREQIRPGAFTASIGRDDVRALVDHDPSLIIGRNKAGTLKLSEDEHGLGVEIDPPDTQVARDLMVSMVRGDVTGMSFGFFAIKQEWDESQEPPLRTIIEAELFDVSVVSFPAYPDTEVALRSLDIYRRQHNFHAASMRIRLAKNLDLRGRRTAA